MTRAFLILLACVRVAAADGREVPYAIVIGNNAPPVRGTSEVLAPLRYADDDAVRYFQLFSRFAETHLLVVLDTQTQRRYPGLAAGALPPTLANLNAVVTELAAKMQADRDRGDRPVLYFAFSGHGARDDQGNAFLALLDGALTQNILYDGVLGRMPATFTHLIVDACNAGGVVGVRGGIFGKELDTHAVATTADDVQPILEATPLARYPQVGVIIATTLGQEAHEWSAIESGVFTHELISGLVGAADVNGDGIIEYTEIQAFVASANRDIKDPRAIPRVIARPPQANRNAPLVALASLRGMRLVRGNARGLGHFHIELENGQRYLDAHVDAKVAIAVPDDTVAFLRTESQEAALPVHGDVAIERLALSGSQIASRGAIEAAYRTQLFSSGYGRSYYEGFVDSIGAVGVQFADDVAGSRATERGHPRIALGSAVVAGLAGATAITTGILAYQAHSDFESTSLQRPAHDAQARSDRYLPVSLAGGAVAIAAGAAAWWLWPRSAVRVSASAAPGAYSFSMELTW